jgi:hypothetical protein
MPWTAKDARAKNDSLKSDGEAESWARVANETLAAELKKGTAKPEAEARAIKAANAWAAEMRRKGGSTREDIHEYADSRGVTLQADAEKGVIRGVKILGLVSKNGREYLPEALRKAVTLYEGRAVNVDHAARDGRRSYRDRIGRLSAVEQRADGLYGDLHFNPKHALAEQLAWDAGNAPENVGLSHDAVGRTVRRGGKTIVEEIESVRSVDLVADPATTGGLFESESEEENRQEGNMSTDLQETTLDQLRTKRPDLVDSILKEHAESEEAKAAAAKLKTLEEENKKLKADVERSERRKAILEELEKAKLNVADKAQVSELFMESLLNAADARAREAIIEDRKSLLAHAGKSLQEQRQGPTSGSRYTQNEGGRNGATLQERTAAWRN